MSNQIEKELNDVIEEIERNAISGEQIRAIFYAYNDNDSIAIKFGETEHAHILNQMMNALCESLILNIYRCWEDGRKSEFRSFPRARALLSHQKLLEKIKSESNSKLRICLLGNFSDSIDTFYNSNRLKLINFTRHERIAHSFAIARDRVKLQIFDQSKMRHLYQTSVYNKGMFKKLYLIWNNTTYDSSDFNESFETTAKEFLGALPSFKFSEIDREYFDWRKKFLRRRSIPAPPLPKPNIP